MILEFQIPIIGQEHFREKRDVLRRLISNPKDANARQRATRLFSDLAEALSITTHLRDIRNQLQKLPPVDAGELEAELAEAQSHIDDLEQDLADTQARLDKAIAAKRGVLDRIKTIDCVRHDLPAYAEFLDASLIDRVKRLDLELLSKH